MESALFLSISKSVTGFEQKATVWSASAQEFRIAMLSEVIPVFVVVPFLLKLRQQIKEKTTSR